MYGTVLYTILNADVDFKAAVGVDSGGNVKLYPSDEVPQTITRPYSTYVLVSRIEDQNKDQRGMYEWNVQIDHYATKQSEVEDIDTACFDALNRYRGVVAGVNVNSIRGQNASEGFSEKQQSRHRMNEFSIKVNP